MTKLVVKRPKELRDLIILNGDTLKSFSKELNVSNQHLSLVVRGKTNPSPALAKKIALKLDTTIDEIFFVDSVQKNNTN